MHNSNDTMIELRHFRLLVQLAESGNLARAGRDLNLSQPAVSRQMGDLEEHCGGALFERKSAPIRFTPLGFRILESAYEVLNTIHVMEAEAGRICVGRAGELRIAVECHSCFDWLMPSMDAFRQDWAEVEMDIVSGFHEDPVGLLHEDRADLVLVSHAKPRAGIKYYPLFRYEMLALLPHGHPLLKKRYLTAGDFIDQTLISYPICDERLDLMREVLMPADVTPKRRVAELTVAILQLVASGRGLAAMANWAVQPYLDRKYVASRPIRRNGLKSNLYIAMRSSQATISFMQAFIETTRKLSYSSLSGIEQLAPNTH